MGAPTLNLLSFRKLFGNHFDIPCLSGEVYEAPASPESHDGPCESDSIPCCHEPHSPISLPDSPECNDEFSLIEDSLCEIRESIRPTIYEDFTRMNLHWCRYCGVTERTQTASFRPGPWGKRTLCNKHGCDYKGYGYLGKIPRLNLNRYINESLEDRIRPILQEFCSACYQKKSTKNNVLVQCDGCCRAYHQLCFHESIPSDAFKGMKWFCSQTCRETMRNGKIAIDLPKRNLPMMKAASRSPVTSPIKKSKSVQYIRVIDTLESLLTTKPSLKKRSKPKISTTPRSSLLWTDVDSIQIPKFVKNEILVPEWNDLSTRSKDMSERRNLRRTNSDQVNLEDVTDQEFILRHKKYEHLERENRLHIY